MIPIKVPKWFDSIRSLVTLALAGGFVYQACVLKKLDPTYVAVFMAAINYYFKDKKRKEE